jgi:hypothetical protein
MVQDLKELGSIQEYAVILVIKVYSFAVGA